MERRRVVRTIGAALAGAALVLSSAGMCGPGGSGGGTGDTIGNGNGDSSEQQPEGGGEGDD